MMTLEELGAMLREARERRGMTVSDIADRLKIPTRILQAIEEDAGRVPRTVYAYNFIKEYALLLGFPHSDVASWMQGLEGFENISRPVLAENHTYTSVKPSKLPAILGGLFKALVLIALACGAYTAYLHFFASRDAERLSSPSGEQAEGSSPVPTWGVHESAALPEKEQEKSETSAEQKDNAFEQAGQSSSPVPLESTPPAAQDAQNTPEAVLPAAPSSAAAEKPAPETPVVLPEGIHQVEVIADQGDCWMGFEPDGKKQQRTLRKGDTFSMTFRDSLIIRFGHARAVRVIYDGKEMERMASSRVVTINFPPAE